MHPEGYYDVDPPTTTTCVTKVMAVPIPGNCGPILPKGENGKLLPGLAAGKQGKRARLPEEHTETPYMTRRCIEFIESPGDLLVVSSFFIKPHWPYIVPAPYDEM
ncbi:MAG: hypothetical protein Ct9H300mP14_05120 [Gammaproteobacteria bacterium]|nr:MAG: hypothetical protein Ct9H300mP14_05120 [Gammaproteobacteria bacterium]